VAFSAQAHKIFVFEGQLRIVFNVLDVVHYFRRRYFPVPSAPHAPVLVSAFDFFRFVFPLFSVVIKLFYPRSLPPASAVPASRCVPVPDRRIEKAPTRWKSSRCFSVQRPASTSSPCAPCAMIGGRPSAFEHAYTISRMKRTKRTTFYFSLDRNLSRAFRTPSAVLFPPMCCATWNQVRPSTNRRAMICRM